MGRRRPKYQFHTPSPVLGAGHRRPPTHLLANQRAAFVFKLPSSCRHDAPHARQIATHRARVYTGLRRESGAGAARGAKQRTPGLGKRQSAWRRAARSRGYRQALVQSATLKIGL